MLDTACEQLSKSLGFPALLEAVSARDVASWISIVKGASGRRFFINEELELFAPVGVAGDWSYVYIGPLSERPWFMVPPGFQAD